MADGDSMRRAVPSPAPKRIFGIDVIKSLLDQGVIVICAGGGGIPTAYARRAGAGRAGGCDGVEAVIDKDLASALLAIEIGADALLIVTDVDAVYADWGTPEQRAIRNATPDELAAAEFAAGSMGPKVRAACWFAERTGGFAAIGSIARHAGAAARRGRHARRARRGHRPHRLREEPRWRRPQPARPTTTEAPTWHVLTRESAAAGAARRARARADERRGGRAPRALRAQPLRRGEDGVALARVPAPVPGPDADRAAGRRRDLDLPGQAGRHRDRDPAADAAQRGARPQPGGQGGGGRGGAGEDDDRQGARAPRRRARAAAGRAARARRRRRDRGRRRRARRRARCSRRRRSRSPRRR